LPAVTLFDLSNLIFSKFDAVAIPVISGDAVKIPSNKTVAAVEKYLTVKFSELLKQWPDSTGKAGELIEIPTADKKLSRIYFIGVGSQSTDELRKAGVALARKVKNSGSTVLDLLLDDSKSATTHTAALILASYSWNQKTVLKGSKAQKPAQFIVSNKYEVEVNFAKVIATGTWLARDLIHTPANIKNPLWMANQAKAIVTRTKSSALTIKVLSGSALKEFGGLLAVGNSAPKPGPRMIQVSYAPKGSSNWPHVVIVGKGITFDTGGVSLKRPYDTMVGMKSDMSGAAAALATVINIAEFGKDAPKVRVTALLMCAENSLSGTAQRPSDVIKHFGGTTVEVINTDAEGRLVLADGLAYADKKLNPDYLIDIATLTGAATLGLGRQYGAMYTRNEKLAKKLYEVGEEIGERLWHMPLVDDYKISLASSVADFNHTAEKPDFSGGSVTAALFLEHFAGRRNWVHLDIAGPARSESDSGENPKGGTGFGVRVLTKWLTSL
jgi:leucyl aminopeptidase